MDKDRRSKILLFSGAAVWAICVAAFVIYFFFPYQKALKIALQNVIGSGRTAVAMEGVSMKTMGVSASRLLLRPVGATGQATPFELTDADISWNPFSLLTGRLAISSKARLYEGAIRCTIDGIPFTGPANPNIVLKLEKVNLAKAPEGGLSWFKGISGHLDGVLKKDAPLSGTDRQSGSFRFVLKDGEVKDIHAKNLPRLIIPYRQIVLEGKIDGPRVDVTKMVLTSDAISIKGGGVMETTDAGRFFDLKATYEVLSKAFPLKGKGVIAISGNEASPSMTISGEGQAAGGTTSH